MVAGLCLVFAASAAPAQSRKALGAPDGDAAFYVSPAGSDKWSGRLAAPNAGKTDGPFATVDRARRAVQQLKADQPKRRKPVVVMIRGGTYELEKTLIFGPEDSGTAESPIVYAAYPGEKPVISGGTALGGWKVTDKGWWQVRLPKVAAGKWDFSQLFVNGRRRYRPRLPEKGYFYVAHKPAATPKAKGKGFDTLGFKAGDIRSDWHNRGDVEILAIHQWCATRFRIAEVDNTKHIVTFTGPTRSKSAWMDLRKGRRYLAINVAEALGEPGRWYLDRKSGVLTYVPVKGEKPDKSVVVAPRLRQIVRLNGEPATGKYVQHITFRGLAFAHTNWVLPPEGLSFPQAEVHMSAAVEGIAARNCTFDRCEIAHTGGYGLELGIACRENLVDGCELTDLAAGGIKIGTTGRSWSTAKVKVALSDETVASHNTVRNCLIARGGRLHPAAVGLWIGQAHHNRFEHSEIFDFYYTGVSIGWTWGYGKSYAHHNRMENNHVHKIGQRVLSDMGGIYTLGISPGTVISGNLFHDILSYDYGGWGLYTDEGSTGIVMENNVVYRTRTGSFHQHYGRDNIIRNNILVGSGKWQLQRTRMEKHRSFTFERNIVYWRTGPLLASNWKDGRFDMDHNLYWNASGKAVGFAGMTLAQWRAKGKDVHSIVADPMFVDPDKFDFRLKAGSPAEKIGFKPFDISKAGRLKGAKRAADLPPEPPAFPVGGG